MRMIILRNGVAAFLRNNGKYLLMKRAENRTYNPGFWSGVGGHMESQEINDPCATCYREITEETGIRQSEISFLELLYVITRRSKDEIRHSYIFFGETFKTGVKQTDEGELFWIHEDKLLDREFTVTFAEMLKHYKARDPQDHAVYIGVAENNNGKLLMKWSRCEDFEV